MSDMNITKSKCVKQVLHENDDINAWRVIACQDSDETGIWVLVPRQRGDCLTCLLQCISFSNFRYKKSTTWVVHILISPISKGPVAPLLLHALIIELHLHHSSCLAFLQPSGYIHLSWQPLLTKQISMKSWITLVCTIVNCKL